MVKRPTEAEILAQLPAADARETAERTVGLRAAEVRYDRKSHRFVLELTSGYLVGVPTRALPHLAEATAATGRRGGLVRSQAKSLAAKVNGAKGGRPRKAAGSS